MNFSITQNGTTITATALSVAHDLGVGAHLQSDIMIINMGPQDVYVRAGQAGVAATTSSMRIMAGEKGTYSKGQATHLAVLSPNGDQAITVFLGSGQ